MLATFVVKVLTLTALAGFGLISVVVTPAPQSITTSDQTRLAEMVRAHRCAPLDMADHNTRRSAVVRTPAGALRQVTYRVGLQMHDGVRRGTLIAVCADPVGSSQRR
ncbi:MAG: hypothetical protein J2O46_05705 [Nocardioides sp.]|nr:hypothetical protein [Nocardioides sp.]